MSSISKELENELLIYYGELIYERDTTFDWMEKDKIIEKMNAITLLIGHDEHQKSWFEKVKETIINKTINHEPK